MSILTNWELQTVDDEQCFGEQINVYTILYAKMLPNISDIQGVTGGMCETSGEFSLGQTIPI